MINRSAISVRKKQPFLDWLRGLPDPIEPEVTLDEINHAPHIYLLPEYTMIDEQEELLADFFDLVFEQELWSWWTDETAWPKRRSFRAFKQWFDVLFHSMIVDVTDEPLIDD